MARKKNDGVETVGEAGDELSTVTQSIQKNHKTVRIRFGEDVDDASRRDNRIRTNNPGLDYILNGGLVRGGAIQIYGEENAGKSFSAHCMSALVQNELHEDVLWVVGLGERFDKRLSTLTGCRWDSGRPASVGYMESASAEDLAEAAAEAVASRQFGLVVVDSLASLRPKDETDKSMDENVKMMGQPNLLNRFITKMLSSLYLAENTALVLLNQARDTHKQEWNGYMMAQAKPHAPGGRYSRHIALADICVEKTGLIYDLTGDKAKDRNAPVIGRTVTFTGMKGKVTGSHGRSVQCDVYTANSVSRPFGPGQVDKYNMLVSLGIKTGVLSSSGTWINFDAAGKKFQGAGQFSEALQNDGELYTLLDSTIYDTYFEQVG